MRNLVTAYLLGSRIIEKHFTNDKSLPGNDHYHAMDKNDLKNFNREIDKIIELLGNATEKKEIKSESISKLNARRSIVTLKDLPKGHKITSKDITYKRPGTGISPMFWDEVLGKTLKISKEEDNILSWEDFEIK